MPDKYFILLFLGFGVLNLCHRNEHDNCNKLESTSKQAVETDQLNDRTTEDSLNNNPSFKSGQAVNVVDGSRRTLQMVEIPGGKFIMGNNDTRFRVERDIPARWVEIVSFYIDVYAVSNEDFELFVKANTYKTEAEKLGESIVEEIDLSEEVKSTVYEAFAEMTWWVPVKGADWRHPEGLDSNIIDRMEHPVVHVSWNDAVAFCSWMGKRLPTEAEWERACKAGIHEMIFYMGDQYMPNNQFRSNMWKGKFSTEVTGEDGCAGHCPVTSHSPNGYGLYNMLGNMWEWTADVFLESDYPGNYTNPGGVTFDELRVMKGEPRMCKQEIRYRYYCADRDGNTPDATSGDMGFRCAADKLPDYLNK